MALDIGPINSTDIFTIWKSKYQSMPIEKFYSSITSPSGHYSFWQQYSLLVLWVEYFLSYILNYEKTHTFKRLLQKKKKYHRRLWQLYLLSALKLDQFVLIKF